MGVEKEEKKVQKIEVVEPECILKVVHPKTSDTSVTAENQTETKQEVDCNLAQSSNVQNISEPETVPQSTVSDPEEIPFIDEGTDQIEEKEQSAQATFDEDLDVSPEDEKETPKPLDEIQKDGTKEEEALESDKLQDSS